ncbi:16798_t:CDS:1, partial [Racocetra persica]
CRINTLQAKKKCKRQETNKFIIEKENTINFTNITDYIYYALLEYKNLNDELEEQASFQLHFDINFDSLNKNILTDITIKEKNLHIADLVVNAISD